MIKDTNKDSGRKIKKSKSSRSGVGTSTGKVLSDDLVDRKKAADKKLKGRKPIIKPVAEEIKVAGSLSYGEARRKYIVSQVLFCLMFFILIILSYWQAIRTVEKEGFISSIVKRQSEVGVDYFSLDGLGKEPNKLLGKKVKLQGIFDNKKFMIVPHRQYDYSFAVKKDAERRKPFDRQLVKGYKFLEMFYSSLSKSWFVVDRGFIPDGKDILPGKISSVVDITGYLRPFDKEQFFLPDPSYKTRTAIGVFKDTFKEWYKVTKIEPMIVVLTKNPEGKLYPIAGFIKVEDIQNNHFNYMLTWVALSIVCMLFTFFNHISWKKSSRLLKASSISQSSASKESGGKSSGSKNLKHFTVGDGSGGDSSGGDSSGKGNKNKDNKDNKDNKG